MAIEVSADTVIAKSPHKKITKVNGKPTCNAFVTEAEKELGESLLAVSCPWDH